MPSSLFDLTGKNALVTGGSKGIGKAVARGLAEQGADVVITSRHEDELKAAAAEIGDGLDIRVETFVGDMTDRDKTDELATWVVETMGGVDILFNNAGSNTPQPLVELTDEVWDRLIELNVTSCMRLTRAIVPQMIERGWGRIIYNASVMALVATEGRSTYCATKAAVVAMVRAQSLEFGRHGITVNAISPGPIMTDLPMSCFSDEQKQAFARRTAVHRWGQPEELAGPVIMLASDAGSFVTGENLVIDGGMVNRVFES